MESTAPPQIQLLDSRELQRCTWAIHKLRLLGVQDIGAGPTSLLQGLLTQLAFDQEGLSS